MNRASKGNLARAQEERGEAKRTYFFYAGALLVSFIIIAARRPDSILNAQFWAEDGRNWYPDAYNNGIITSLLTPEAGYLQTFSRLVAVISQLLPLGSAPLFFNLCAIGVQLTVVGFVLSKRFSRLIPELQWRTFFAFIYLALPHSAEIYANLTNAQWHIALLASLIILLPAGGKALWTIFDVAVVSVSVLSGPFGLLLLPIASLKCWFRPEKRMIWLTVILLCGSLIQTFTLLTTVRPIQPELGSSGELFFRIVGRHVFASPIIGGRGFISFVPESIQVYFSLAVSFAGFFLIGYAFMKSRLELRLFILLSSLVIAAALYSPAVTLTPGQWNVIAANETALRYWFIPALCLYASLCFLAAKAGYRMVRYAAAAILMVSLVGIVKDWRISPLTDLNFQQYARDFESAAPGTEVRIPVNPNWEMKLIKK